MKKIFAAWVICVSMNAYAQLPVVSSGTLIRHEMNSGKYVSTRNVDVWLPEGYSTKKKYAVLYMHDGQMLFDSTVTWTKQEWGVDETMSLLTNQKKIRNCIVVGIWNSGASRHQDYFPQKPMESLSSSVQDSLYHAKRGNGQNVFAGKVASDKYLQFLVMELKPFIDNTYSTRKDMANTFIAGSSMGGLISMYAICEYPEVFGGAACLSTHWPGIFQTDNNPIPDAFFQYLEKSLPNPADHKIYFDYGTTTLDSMYKPYQLKADVILQRKGYEAEKNWITKEFPGEDHSERAWKKRLSIPLLFLLPR